MTYTPTAAPSSAPHRGDSAAVGLVAALSVTGVSAGAHVVGGGHLPDPTYVLLALTVVAVSSYSAGEVLFDRLRRRAWLTLVALFGAGQLSTHLLWGAAASFATPAVGGAHHHGTDGDAASLSMLTVHALGTAVSLALTVAAVTAVRHVRAQLLPLLRHSAAVVERQSTPRAARDHARPITSVAVTLVAPHRGPPRLRTARAPTRRPVDHHRLCW